MKLDRGDVIVCPFILGDKGNYISKAPDGKTVVIDKSQELPIIPRTPYICTIKAAVTRENGEPRVYVVRVDHVANVMDYDTIEEVDYENAKFTLKLKYPTHENFKWARFMEVDAEVTERALPRTKNGSKRMELILRHGNFERRTEISREDALRMGIRFNYFVPLTNPPKPLQPRLEHPNAKYHPDWVPTLLDHTGYLLQPTEKLLEKIPEVLKKLNYEKFVEMGKKRLTQVLALRAYDVIPPDSPEESALEDALTGLTRLALLTHKEPEGIKRLILAEKNLLKKYAKHQSKQHLLALLNSTGGDYEYSAEKEVFNTDVNNFLQLTAAYTHGKWALNNLNLEKGRIYFKRDHAEALLAEHLVTIITNDETPIDKETKDRLQPLHEHIDWVLMELEKTQEITPQRRNFLSSYPPCVANALHKALDNSLQEAEAYLASSFLHKIGIRSEQVAYSLYGIQNVKAGKYVTPNSTGKAKAKTFLPPSCELNKSLGICSWTCEGVKSPSDYYNQNLPEPKQKTTKKEEADQ